MIVRHGSSTRARGARALGKGTVIAVPHSLFSVVIPSGL